MKTTLSSVSLVLAGLVFAVGGCSSTGQEHFDTPEKAAESLVSALRADDTKDLSRVLGPGAARILDSGDAVADRAGRDQFVADFEAAHSITDGPNAEKTLIVGAQQWPLPIPLVHSPGKGGWYFDTAAGEEELLNRRIGRNELRTIQTCLSIVDAQREYALLDPNNDGIAAYAQRVLSTPGKKDGLYWPTAAGEPLSPLGEEIAAAAAEGYSGNRDVRGRRLPFHGYYYRLLTAQGPAAPGGVMNYMINGKLIAGFGILAWPAEYGNSGVMTFIVNQDGIVYEQDLGGPKAPAAINLYNPGPGWNKSDTSALPD